MPANLPPQFYALSAKLKEAKTPEEKISILEELLAIIPKHKGTEKVQKDLKSKIAKLKRQKPKKIKREALYSIPKEGAGQIVIIGPANSGKSSLLNTLTNAKAKVAPYPFTTQVPQPAMMPYQNILIQLVDTPPLTKDSPPWLKGILKAADGLLAIFDLSKDNLVEDIKNLKEILNNWGITNKKILFLGNKVDELCSSLTLRSARVIDLGKSQENLKTISCLKGTGVDESLLHLPPHPTSWGSAIEELKKEVFDLLEIVRVYSKPPGKLVDFKEPFILKRNSKLIDFAKQIRQDLISSFKYAKLLKRDSPKIQIVGKDYLLQDQDIIEIHT